MEFQFRHAIANHRRGQRVLRRHKRFLGFKHVTNLCPARLKEQSSALHAPVGDLHRLGLDAQALEKLVDLKLKLDAAEARKAFSEALARFQGEIENVAGTREGSKTSKGILTFRYAPLGDIMHAIRKPLTGNGLSVTFDSEFLPEKKVRKTSCTVTHELGHKETSYFESELDPGTSLMNPLQKQGSTLKYGQRYSLCMALGIVTEAEDDDGNAGGKVETKNGKLITENEAKKITAMIQGV